MDSKEKIINVSCEDRAQITALQKTIKDVEKQIATIIGSYVEIKDARIATADEMKKHVKTPISFEVIGGETSATGAFCIIYMDPPGICYPCVQEGFR